MEGFHDFVSNPITSSANLYNFCIVLGRGTLWHLRKFLQYIKYVILNSCPPSFFSILPPLHSCNSFNRYHFSIYIHVYTVFSLYSPPPKHIHCFPSLVGANFPSQDLFHSPVLQFFKGKKNWHFCLFKIAI
jgi:hypothetical protein